MGKKLSSIKQPNDWRHFIPGNEAQLIRGGSAYFEAVKKLIQEASTSIQFHTYIFAPDQTGEAVHRAMLEAAHRGVKVQVLLDDYGSQELRKHKIWLAEWKSAGIDYRFFGPFFTGGKFNLGRRLHHKVLIVDHRHALVGGQNIADRYNDLPGQRAWLDFALQVSGPAAPHLAERIHVFWKKQPLHPTQLYELRSIFKPAGKVPVRIIQNDYLRGVRAISDAYFQAINEAQERVLIVGAYFLPGRKIRKSLQRAISNGAEVKVVLGHHSDVWLAQHASRYLYRWLLRNRIQLFEWTPTVLHGKIAVVDDHWSTVGSYNINYLSAYESIELNFEVWDKKTTSGVAETIQEIIENECDPINAETFRQTRTIANQLKEWFAYRFFRFMIRVMLIFGGRTRKYGVNH